MLTAFVQARMICFNCSRLRSLAGRSACFRERGTPPYTFLWAGSNPEASSSRAGRRCWSSESLWHVDFDQLPHRGCCGIRYRRGPDACRFSLRTPYWCRGGGQKPRGDLETPAEQLKETGFRSSELQGEHARCRRGPCVSGLAHIDQLSFGGHLFARDSHLSPYLSERG